MEFSKEWNFQCEMFTHHLKADVKQNREQSCEQHLPGGVGKVKSHTAHLLSPLCNDVVEPVWAEYTLQLKPETYKVYLSILLPTLVT